MCVCARQRTVRFVDPDDFEGFDAAVDDKTRAIFAETVANPSLVITDMERLAAVAKANGKWLLWSKPQASGTL